MKDFFLFPFHSFIYVSVSHQCGILVLAEWWTILMKTTSANRRKSQRLVNRAIIINWGGSIFWSVKTNVIQVDIVIVILFNPWIRFIVLEDSNFTICEQRFGFASVNHVFSLGTKNSVFLKVLLTADFNINLDEFCIHKGPIPQWFSQFVSHENWFSIVVAADHYPRTT